MKVTLTHWTHRRNVRSILRRGLLTAYATGKRKAVWCCSMGHAEWARNHVAARHGWSSTDVVCLEVQVNVSRLCRHSTEGVFYSYRNIQPSDISGVFDLKVSEEAK